MDEKDSITEHRYLGADGETYNLTLNADGTAGMVNRVGKGRMTPEETAAMAARLHAATGQPVLTLKHTFNANPSLKRKPCTNHHSYTKRLLALKLTENTIVQLRHQP